LTAEDLSFLLDSLWDSLDPEESDDDIVTRLWSKNLSSITLVTAEEIAKASTSDDFYSQPAAGREDIFSLRTAGTVEATETSLSASGITSHTSWICSLSSWHRNNLMRF